MNYNTKHSLFLLLLWKHGLVVTILLFCLSLSSCRIDLDQKKLFETPQSEIALHRELDSVHKNKAISYGDFNGDGILDTAKGCNDCFVDNLMGAGDVDVTYGNNAISAQTWNQNSPGIAGASEEYDSFGTATATGDFNNDGYDDLAVGVPLEDINSITAAGCVNIIYGSANGLTSTGNQLWHQNTGTIEGACEAGDFFGYNLATGDVNGDGYTDLMVCSIYESIGSVARAGMISLLLGSSGGITDVNNKAWHLDSPGIPGNSRVNDYFGDNMVVGDFNNDNYADLAVGVLLADINNVENAGAVYYIPGSSTGLTATGSQEWTAASPGINNTLLANGLFGDVLVVGGFNNASPGIGYADLAIGYSSAIVNNVSGAGEVYILYGTVNTGFRSDRIQRINRNSPGIDYSTTKNDFFGYKLESGFYDTATYEDLKISSYSYPDAYFYGGVF